MEYRCNYLGADGRIASSQTIYAKNDRAALTLAKREYTRLQMPHYGYEVWGPTNLVHIEPPDIGSDSSPKEKNTRSFRRSLGRAHHRKTTT
jgi:hypothetical protein